MDIRTQAELEKYEFKFLMNKVTGGQRWQWKNEFFVDIADDGSWTHWSKTGGEPKKGKGFTSLKKYLDLYHT